MIVQAPRLDLIAIAAVVVTATAGVADDRGDFGPYDNRCTLSRITMGGQPLASDMLTDGDLVQVVTRPAPSAEILVEFRGAPRWLNQVALHGASHAFQVDVRDAYGSWDRFGSGKAAPGDAELVIGSDVYVDAVRVRAEAPDDAQVAFAEIEAFFIQVDPDEDGTDGSGDGYEYFYEWVEDYPTSPLYDCEPDAENLCNGLSSAWSCRGYGDWSAWEEDFKRNDLGGTNGVYVDSADLSYFSGHGSSTFDSYWGGNYRAMIFADTAHDDGSSIPSDARAAWDNDLEWMAFSSCNILSFPSRAKWHEAMAGARALFGWADSIPDKKYGKKWAKGMNGTSIFDPAHTLKQAWFDMAESKLGAGYDAVVVGETSAMGNDYLWGEGTTGTDPVHDGSYTVWTYTTTSATATGAPASELTVIERTGPRGVRVRVPHDLLEEGAGADAAMPVFLPGPVLITPLIVDLLADRFCRLFPILCEGDFPEPTDEDTINKVSGPIELRVSTLTGGYELLHSGLWWRTYDEAPDVPSADDARDTAQAVLTQLEQLPASAEFWQVRTATQSIEENGAASAVVESFPVHRQVIFRRRLAGFPVFGAGAQLSVCVGPNGVERINRNAWRPVEIVGQIDAIPFGEAMDRIAEHGADAALDGLSGIFSELEVVSATLGYFEADDETKQGVMRPVWYVSALGTELDGTEVFVRFAVEADPNPLAVTMTGPIGPGEFCFDAEVSGGVPPYAYLWSSSVDGDVGGAEDLCYTPGDPGDPDKGSVAAHVLTVEVRDAADRIRRARVTFTTCQLPDVDGDGTVGVSDLLLVLEAWGDIVEPGSGADVDGDGTVGVGDLLLILQFWGQNC